MSAVAAPSWLSGASQTVLAPNIRQARALREAADAQAAAAGPGSIWLTARILTIQAWTRELWMDAAWTGTAQQVLLNTAQELQLWRRVILESEEADRLLQIDAAAQLAADAWRTLHAWRLPWTPAVFDPQEDSAAFYRWSRRYAQLCEQNNWLDAARLPDALTAPQIDAPVRLQDPHLLTPQQRALLDRLPNGWQPAEPVARPTNALAYLASFQSPSAEVQAAAAWCAQTLASHPQARIGIVYTSNDILRDLDRALLDALHPAQKLWPNPDAQRRYTLAQTRTLAAEPLVRTALLALQLSKGSLPLAEAGSLLRSPFLGRALQERAARAVLDAELRRSHPEHLTLAAISNGAKTKAPVLATLLAKFEKARRSLPKAALPSAWALQFARLLRTLDWPGSEALSAYERGVIETWNEVLGDYASLDSVVPGPEPLSAALHTVSSLARSRRAPQRDLAAPIEVLPFAEAEGLTFDHLWVLGCTADHLPAPARPNPFLPGHLLRARSVPGSSAELELDRARRVLQSLRHAAPEIVFSHALRDGERDLRLSTIVSSLPDLEPYTATDPAPQQQLESAPLEHLTDHAGPPILPGTKQRGGTRILLLQAACPFRAFAEMRLHLRPLESGEPGLNPRDRGRLLHDSLQMIWSHLQGSERLLATSPAELRELVEGSIRQCQALYPPQDAFERELLELECERLTAVLLEWLESEKKRAPFVVIGHEQARTIELGSLRIDARVDRVDRIPGAGDVIIDYKTGDMPADPWTGDRMAEPQMPVYAISHPSKVGGLLIGLVSNGAMEFKGYYPGAGKPLPIEEWRKAVTKLADQFAAGVATLDPKQYPKTCEYCAAGPLCRITDAEPAFPESDSQI
ncbi:hypothetical protein F183_A42950 [Bryobacterales bacterium F-183]|nr:hypothetical protein F183_A42950 [Bryobacterales bacterium F-183]